jgi:putative ABC transport system permease protein
VYPNLTPTLAVLLGLALAIAAVIALRRPVLRRLALRQVNRRRGEAALVVAGSVLGTAIIVGSLVVGDTLNFSVKQIAYDNLGPIDEYVSAHTVAQGDQAARRIERLRGDPDIDGILSLRGDQAAVTRGSGQARKAEPRASVWEVDFTKAAAFGGGVRRGSGLSGPAPGPGEAVINQDLADAIDAHRGDTLTVYLYGKAREVRVARVVPTSGLAGVGVGDVARNLFVGPGVLVEAARSSGAKAEPRAFTFVSNTGDVEGGNRRSDAVERKLRAALGPLTTQGVAVDKPNQSVLEAATRAGDGLGSLFLFIGSFSVIAGVLLLVTSS